MQCMLCQSMDFRRYGTWRPKGSQETIQRFQCRACRHVQSEDAASPAHGLKKGSARSAGGETVFRGFWRHVAAVYPLTPLEDALERGMKRFGISLSTVQRWYRGGRLPRNPSDLGIDSDVYSALRDSLVLWDEGIRNRRKRAKQLLDENLTPEPLPDIAGACQVDEARIQALITRAHSFAIRGDGEAGIVTLDDLPDRSRAALTVGVHKHRARIPLPVALFDQSLWSPTFKRTGWYLLREQVRDLFSKLEGASIPNVELLHTFVLALEDNDPDLRQVLDWDYYEKLEPRIPLVPESRWRELNQAFNLQFEADLQARLAPTGSSADGLSAGGAEPREYEVFGAATFVAVRNTAVICSVIRHDAVDGESSLCGAAEEGVQGTWLVDLERSTEQGELLF